MSMTKTLSEAAVSLFRLHIERKGHIAVDNSTREPYRELARAGLMMAGSTFRDGEESIYCLTKAGYDLKIELLASSAFAPACGLDRRDVDLPHRHHGFH
jgi:hypothetical protein